MNQRIYLASSWRNTWHSYVLAELRKRWEVYDFRRPDQAFSWSDIDQGWQAWNTDEYIEALTHEQAERGFRWDMDALKACDTCVLLLPAGRSASLELGWAAGAGKRTAVLILEPQEPELMVKVADFITADLDDLCSWLAGHSPGKED